jgi:hypothetical protein
VQVAATIVTLSTLRFGMLVERDPADGAAAAPPVPDAFSNVPVISTL